MNAMSRRRAIETAVVLLAAFAAIAPIPEVVVERWFSTGFYPRLQHVLTPVANLVPFAWFDVILLTVITLVVVALVRGVRQARQARRLSPLLATGWTLVVAGGVVYLLFLGCWGLNYRRVPMTERLEMAARPPGGDAVAMLATTAVERLNALHDA